MPKTATKTLLDKPAVAPKPAIQTFSTGCWEPNKKYAEEFEHSLWTKWKDKAKGTGHGGGDFYVIQQFLAAVNSGNPSPIGAVDAATWSCILPLSHKSIIKGNTVQQVPDFSEGKWQKRQA